MGEARNTDLKAACFIGLDEALTALEESICDLNDEQVRAFPIAERNNIVWIVMHCFEVLDWYANNIRRREEDRTYPYDPRWEWNSKRPQPGEPFPTQVELMGLLKKISDKAREQVAAVSEDELRKPFGDPEKLRSDAYMRAVYHTMAHVRQIWLLRGALGLTDGKSWPDQHWS